jgi:hypothetical protein
LRKLAASVETVGRGFVIIVTAITSSLPVVCKTPMPRRNREKVMPPRSHHRSIRRTLRIAGTALVALAAICLTGCASFVNYMAASMLSKSRDWYRWILGEFHLFLLGWYRPEIEFEVFEKLPFLESYLIVRKNLLDAAVVQGSDKTVMRSVSGAVIKAGSPPSSN